MSEKGHGPVSRIGDYLFGIAAGAIFLLALLSGLPRLQNDSSIRIVAPLLPPHVDEVGQGADAEIIVAALRAGGITEPVEFHVLPFTRHWHVYKQDTRFHGVATVPASLELDGSRSASYTSYQNGIIYRKGRFQPFETRDNLKALAGKTVVAFAGAGAILPDVRDLQRTSGAYIERADQMSHTIMFARGVADAVIADELIFGYYARIAATSGIEQHMNEIVFDPLFCATPYFMYFRQERLREAFDRGLTQMQRSGELARIEQRARQGRDLARSGRRSGGCV